MVSDNRVWRYGDKIEATIATKRLRTMFNDEPTATYQKIDSQIIVVSQEILKKNGIPLDGNEVANVIGPQSRTENTPPTVGGILRRANKLLAEAIKPNSALRQQQTI